MKLFRALRVLQWSKNLLVFVPLLGAHRWDDPATLAAASLAFVAWCLAASAMYVVNDVADRDDDRGHPHKRTRPFASGALSPRAGWTLAAVLAASAALLASRAAPAFQLCLAAYVAIALAYSAGLKRLIVVDVLILAFLYNLRIFAGGAATGIRVSEWLVAFATFFFLSLALMKRHAELGLSRDTAEPPSRRGYRVRDREAIGAFGAAAACASVVVMALYVSGRDVALLYSRPAWLWAICPLLLYWLARAWLLAYRGEMRDDPLLFAQTDPASYAVLGLLAAVTLVAL